MSSTTFKYFSATPDSLIQCHNNVFSWHPVLRFLKIHKHAIKLLLPISPTLIVRFGKSLPLHGVWLMCNGQAQCVFTVLFCFVYITLLKLQSCTINVCTRRIHSASYAGVLPIVSTIIRIRRTLTSGASSQAPRLDLSWNVVRTEFRLCTLPKHLPP